MTFSEENNFKQKILKSGFLNSSDRSIAEGSAITDGYTHTLTITFGNKNRSVSWYDGAEKISIPVTIRSVLKTLDEILEVELEPCNYIFEFII